MATTPQIHDQKHLIKVDVQQNRSETATAQLAEDGLVIVRLLNPGSIPALVMRRCVPGKHTLRVFPIEAKQSTRCCDRDKKKICLGMVR